MAKKAPGKTPVQSGKAKLRWKKQGDGGLVAATYSIVKSGEKFKAVVKKGGKSTNIIDGVSDGRAYTVLTRFHHYGEMPDGKKAVAS